MQHERTGDQARQNRPARLTIDLEIGEKLCHFIHHLRRATQNLPRTH